jgi:hypothetical protein
VNKKLNLKISVQMIVCFLIFLNSQKVESSVAVRNDVIVQMFSEGRYRMAAAYVDSILLIKDKEKLEEKIRLLLIAALADGHLGDFSKAYSRVNQARELFIWSGFRESITYNESARRRIESSLELVMFDLRNMESLL